MPYGRYGKMAVPRTAGRRYTLAEKLDYYRRKAAAVRRPVRRAYRRY